MLEWQSHENFYNLKSIVRNRKISPWIIECIAAFIIFASTLILLTEKLINKRSIIEDIQAKAFQAVNVEMKFQIDMCLLKGKALQAKI